jgi:hypothetical protein
MPIEHVNIILPVSVGVNVSTFSPRSSNLLMLYFGMTMLLAQE